MRLPLTNPRCADGKIVPLCGALLALGLAACDAPSSPSLGQANGVSAAAGAAAPMADAEFLSLSSDEQYRVANKLLGTLYRGIPVDDFYTLEAGFALRGKLDPGFSLSTLRTALSTDLDDETRARLDAEIAGDDTARDAEGHSAPIEATYRFDDRRPKQMPLARMQHYPLSRDMYSQWMAWQLANTILFSPAEEIDSADLTDVQNLFRRLDLGITAGRSIREMVATHQHTVENWRRFRSPEDNTREMMEIWLGMFDNDAQVPLASQACQDLYLTDERDGYKLAYTDYPNTEAVLVLDRYVTSCSDFYDVVASHPLLIPRVVSVLVDRLYAGLDVQTRSAVAQAIVATNPRTFEDVFDAMLFSRTYLLDVERPKAFEESFFGMAQRLKWDTHPDVMLGLIGGRGALARTEMEEMGWPAMSLKLGRVSDVPLDSLSFGNYHKAIRETLMLDRNRWRVPLGLMSPPAPEPAPVPPLKDGASARDIAAHDAATAAQGEAIEALGEAERNQYFRDLADYERESTLYRKVDDLNVDELLDYLFLTGAQRRARDVERAVLRKLFEDEGHLDAEFDNRFAKSGRQDDIASITLDYLSRLPETYYLPRLR